MTMHHAEAVPKMSKRQVGRHRTACAACRLARKRCDGEVPCSRCKQAHVTCVPVGLEQSRVGKRPLPVSDAENGAAALGEAPASHLRPRPPTAAVRTDPPSSYVSGESLASTGISTHSYRRGRSKSSGMMATLRTGSSSAPPDIPQGSASQPVLPMRSTEREHGDVSLSSGTAVTMGGCEEKVSPPSVPPAAEVFVAAGAEEGPIHAVAGNATALGEKMPEEGKSHEDWTSMSLEKSHIEVEEALMDGGIGDIAEEAGDCQVGRPIGEIDNLAVAFEAACRGVPELSLEGKLDISRAKFILTGLDFAFLLMGSGFSYPAFLRVLRHYVTIGEPHAKSASAADSASTAMSFLVDHAMAVADPHYRPPPCDPSYASAPASDRPLSSEHLSSQDNKSLSGPLAAPSLYISQQEHEWVAGPNGIGHLISRGSASNRRRLGPGDLASQVSWINELWSDPQAAACSFSIMELEKQPILALRTNAYMAKEYVDEKELAIMSDQLKTMAPMLLARFMTSASTTRFFTLLSHNLSYENGEGDCFVEMINRRGQLIGCLATIRWHYGPQHSLVAARFVPLSSLRTSPTKQPALSPPLNPTLFSIISSMASDATHRCAISSVVPTDESLPVSASLRPAPSASLGGQARWPLLDPSVPPSPPCQAWQDLPTEPLPLQGLQAPVPPASAALAAQAGPGSSTVAQAAAPMVGGSAWPSWAAVAGEDAACSVVRVGTSPVLWKTDSDDAAVQPLAGLPIPDVINGVIFDDEEMQLLLDSIA